LCIIVDVLVVWVDRNEAVYHTLLLFNDFEEYNGSLVYNAVDDKGANNDDKNCTKCQTEMTLVSPHIAVGVADEESKSAAATFFFFLVWFDLDWRRLLPKIIGLNLVERILLSLHIIIINNSV
jgi:hypothetical protein